VREEVRCEGRAREDDGVAAEPVAVAVAVAGAGAGAWIAAAGTGAKTASDGTVAVSVTGSGNLEAGAAKMLEDVVMSGCGCVECRERTLLVPMF
jgi:hypothetical protein